MNTPELSRYKKVKQHLKDNKKVYLVGAGGVAVGAAAATAVVMAQYGGFPLEVSQTAKNTALIVWKPKVTQIALVKNACPDPIPVMDKLTGESYCSMRRAAAVTKMAYDAVRKDANGVQERFVTLPDSVFA